jgi:hypothetical protein
VFAIQAQRAGTKNQPSPEGLGWNPHHDPERRRRGTHAVLNYFEMNVALEATEGTTPSKKRLFLQPVKEVQTIGILTRW